MGSFFMLSTLDITGWSDGDATTELIRRARSIETIPDDDTIEHGNLDEYRDALVQHIEDGLLDDSFHDTTTFMVGDRMILAAGAMSSGDLPAGAEAIAMIDRSGILDDPPPWAADSPCVIAYGNAFDGITLEGPFGDREDAGTHAEATSDGTEWYIIDLEAPSTPV